MAGKTAPKGVTSTMGNVYPKDGQDADAVARTQAAEAQAAKVKDIEKRKVYVAGCQSCENYAAGYTDALTCKHDAKK